MAISPGGPTPESRRVLRTLCVASGGWAFCCGLGAPLASLWLRDAGYNAFTIGLSASIYYLGVAVASLLVPWMMRRGSRGCVALGMLIDALATALFPWVGGWAGWFLLRLVGGVGTALCLIPVETWVNHNAPPHRRARDFGLYAFAVASGLGLGSLAGLPLYPLAPRLAFALGGLVTLAAALLAWCGLPVVGPPVEETGTGAALDLGGNLLSFGTAWAQGFFEGGMVAFLSIYLLQLGHSAEAVSGLFGGLFLGVIAFQVPVAWLADRLGRLPVLLACYAVLLAGLAGMPFCTGAGALAVWLFLLGACCGAMYPLGLALLGERVAGPALARANAWYLASNCAGSLSGPVLLGLTIDLVGPRAQFAACALALLIVLAAAAVAARVRAVAANVARADDAGCRSNPDEQTRRIAG